MIFVCSWFLLQGMNGPSPRLVLPDGTILVGKFEETIGTQMVFSDTKNGENSIDNFENINLVCHTDKKINFKKEN